SRSRRSKKPTEPVLLDPHKPIAPALGAGFVVGAVGTAADGTPEETAVVVAAGELIEIALQR
ncbi:MAG TPA: hypothetical protein VKM69_00495, partial [Natronoarchaeum rubrum]|nr:hypothetical protein [Natronoarchaeum rubrum]